MASKSRIYPDAEPGRALGYSTALALRAISDAILHPGTEVKLRDHHGTRMADEHLMHMVSDLISRLDLQFMVVGRSRLGRPMVKSTHVEEV